MSFNTGNQADLPDGGGVVVCEGVRGAKFCSGFRSARRRRLLHERRQGKESEG